MAPDQIGPSGDRIVAHGGELYRIDEPTGKLCATGIDESILPILNGIDSYRTPREHAQDIAEKYHGLLAPNDVAPLLGSLQSAGLLVSKESLLSSLPVQESPGRAAEPLSHIFTPSDKPLEKVQSVIRSIADQISTDPGHASSDYENAKIVFSAQGTVSETAWRSLKSLLPKGIEPLCSDSRSFHVWLRTITAGLPGEEEDLCRTATGLGGTEGFRAGTNRNRILLMGAGLRFVISDDDQPSRFAQLDQGDRLLTSRFNPLEYSPFASIVQLTDTVGFSPLNPLALHGRHLSEPIPELLR